MKKNHYEILQVQPDAHPAIIKTAYRTMMRELKMHPDLGGESGRAQELNEAYQVLSDPEKRRAYDKTLPSPAGAAAITVVMSPGRGQNKLFTLLAAVFWALLLAAASLILYYSREKEPVWIGGEINVQAKEMAAGKR